MADFIAKLYELVKSFFDSIIDLVKMLVKLPEFIISYLNILPKEIYVIFVPIITVIVAVFLYRLLK